jgi:hypothetical protein
VTCILGLCPIAARFRWPIAPGVTCTRSRPDGRAHLSSPRVGRSPMLRSAARGVHRAPASLAGLSGAGVAAGPRAATQAAKAGRGTTHHRPPSHAPGMLGATRRHALRRPTKICGSCPARVEKGDSSTASVSRSTARVKRSSATTRLLGPGGGSSERALGRPAARRALRRALRAPRLTVLFFLGRTRRLKVPSPSGTICTRRASAGEMSTPTNSPPAEMGHELSTFRRNRVALFITDLSGPSTGGS